MATSKIKTMLTTETITAQTTTAQYDGYYYVDVPVSQASNIISIVPISMTNNQSAFCQIINNTIRVWTKLANANITLRVTRINTL